MRPWIRLIPPALVRAFADRYVAGDSLERALQTSRDLSSRGLCTTLDLLAEDIHSPEMARGNVDTYRRMIDAVAADATFPTGRDRPTVSLKLSSYTTAPLEAGGDAAGSREAALEVIEHARRRGVDLTIDMESRHWTDFTLELFAAARAAGHDHVGTVLQTRLHRTEGDIARLPPRSRVRLVIGIYNEPPEVATTDKRVMKERLLAYGATLLRAGHYLELGTHDEAVIRRFIDEVVPTTGVGPDSFEVQMLYGVPRDQLHQELRRRGITTRLYVPFAVGWPMAIAYLRRRLDEYPRMMLLVAKNLVLGER